MPPSGIVPVVGAEVPVVERQRLLEPGRVRLLGHRHQRQVVVPHVVPADDVGAVGQPVRVPVVRRAQQQRGRVDRTAGHHDDVARRAATVVPSPSLVTTAVTVRPVASVSSRSTWALVISATLSCASAGSTQMTWASDFAPEQAREAVDPVAADAGAGVGRPAVRRPGSRFTPIGRWNGCSPCFSRSSLSCWMRGSCCDRRERVLRAGRPLGGVLAVPAVHQVQVLGLGVVRLQVLVPDRPGRRDPAVVAQLAEVLAAAAGTARRRRTWCCRRRSS